MKKLIVLIVVVFLSVSLAGCRNNAPITQQDYEKQAAIVAAIEAMFEAQNTLQLDKLDEILSIDYKRVAADVNTSNLDELKLFLTRSHAQFSKYDMQIEDIATNREGGFVRWRFIGVYVGPGAEPQGSDIDVSGLAHYKYSGGKLTHEFIGFNPGWFQAQIRADAERLVKPY